MLNGPVKVRIEGDVVTLVLARPPANAVDAGLREALTMAIASAVTRGARCIVLTGEGRLFSAGNDLAELADVTDGAAFALEWTELLRAIRRCPVPVVAAINGPAHGGGLELALAADIRVAAPTATFAMTALRLGLVLDPTPLVAAVGASRARDMMLTARVLPAEEALNWGLVSRLVPSEKLEAEVARLAQAVAGMPSCAAVADAKQLLDRACAGAQDPAAAFPRLFAGHLSNPIHVASRAALRRALHARPSGEGSPA